MVDIYIITNTINGKQYIGVASGGWKHRWDGHRYSAYTLKENTRLAKAIRKYGEDAFEIEVIACVEDLDDAYYMEQYYIAKYKTFYKSEGNHGYNMTKGGRGGMGHNERAVIQVDLQGNFVNEFISIKQAVKETGVPSNSVVASAKIVGIFEGRITRDKWRWCYKEDYEKEVLEYEKSY